MMRPEVMLACSIAKEGEPEGHNEDVFEFAPAHDVIALADGASQSCLGQSWAKHLVHAFCGVTTWQCASETDSLTDRFERWLASARGSWTPPTLETLPEWLRCSVTREGGFAAFAGLVLAHLADDDGSGGRATIYSVGDCCIFHTRLGKLLRSFPIDDPDKFNQSPPLICSRPNAFVEGEHHPSISEFEIEPDDCLILASDGLAQGLLRESATTEGKVWGGVASLTDARYADFVADLRLRKQARNDDCSLVVMRITHGDCRALAEPV